MASFVALLRGINVGGRNKVPMADLRAAFESGGYSSVRTYIQSGNVLFESDRTADGIEADLEDLLARELGMQLVVVVRSLRQLRSIVRDAPEGFGQQPDTFHSDVVFLKAPLSAPRAMKVVQTRDGVDRAWPGRGVLYFERLSERRSQSRMSRIMGTPEYQRMTIRSWSTTTRLLTMLEPD
jgi:uncharacterized protein (DUF1697 family)